jgi:ABC-type multidrug transport system ATPase subunit
VAELIGLWRTYYPDPRPLGGLLEVVELAEVRNTQVRKLSGGQRRRLDFALALAGDPDLIFLDEPTTGFDPEAQTGNAAMTLRLLLAWAAEHGLGDLDGLAVTAPRLEEAYLSLTQDPP